MNNKKTNILAFIILTIMFIVSILSMNKDALTYDESAHIPAGYSYLKYQDYRINPEHPPLIKSLSAIPLLFKNLNFPENSENWQQKEKPPAWWVQFDLGNEFIYKSENNPREIIFWSRIPMILMLLLLGLFIFKWAREIGGNKTAIGSLLLFAFSPTMIAHGRFVTTDVGSALGVVIATYYWINYLKNPILKNIISASIAFGFALLFKFSLALLIPFFAIITLIYPFVNQEKNKFKNLAKYIILSILIGICSIIFIIWPIYIHHNWNQPIEQQIRDTQFDLKDNPTPAIRDVVYKMTEIEHVRHLAQYFRGLLMATQRTGFGNNVYLFGEISAKGWWYYFPVIYLMKEPIPLHLLSLLALIGIIFVFIKTIKRKPNFLKSFFLIINKNYTIFSFFVFIAIYWAAAIIGNLNIGVRHLIPTFPFAYIIISEFIKRFLIEIKYKKQAIILIAFCFSWYLFSSLSSYPDYIPYYNELAGGSDKAYIHAVDSNYDWGQDFYKLVEFIEEKEINKIYIDYFGGEDLDYWLKDKYQRINPREISRDLKNGVPINEAGGGIQGWTAISINQLMGGIAKPVPNFINQETGYYEWIEKYEPVGRAGKSIFIYYID